MLEEGRRLRLISKSPFVAVQATFTQVVVGIRRTHAEEFGNEQGTAHSQSVSPPLKKVWIGKAFATCWLGILDVLRAMLRVPRDTHAARRADVSSVWPMC